MRVHVRVWPLVWFGRHTNASVAVAEVLANGLLQPNGSGRVLSSVFQERSRPARVWGLGVKGLGMALGGSIDPKHRITGTKRGPKHSEASESQRGAARRVVFPQAHTETCSGPRPSSRSRGSKQQRARDG